MTERPLRHRTLYIPSGDIVLRAKDENYAYLYRVHRATLLHYAPKLADVLQSATESDSVEEYDGAPVVDLPESQTEVKAFLEVVYGNEHTHMKRQDPGAALFAAKALVLITKYDCRELRARVVRHIGADWPQSPREWLALHQMRRACVETAKFLAEDAPVENIFPEPASVIRLAQDYDIPSVLPAAYLELVSVSRKNDWDALRQGGGHSPFASLGSGLDWDAIGRDARLPLDVRSARWSLLTRDDKARLKSAKLELQARCMGLRKAVFNVPRGNCTGPSLDCQTELKFHRGMKMVCDMDDDLPGAAPFGRMGYPGQLEDMRQLVFDGRYYTSREKRVKPDPMALLQDLFECVPDYGLCQRCCDGVRYNIAREMQRIWADLPAIFGLPQAISTIA
ncbi:hypothetical protein PsYK624_129980 [Phanerochaete sordida]|uniref:BTB domain-containing protein n=1 Tax=Phanerochaete sordida TaxID=48140 RepID=A0A9P3LK19_9APHY|nr:hypothetical protein PsYK624_129980 [Phanerochaete sordida]